MADFSTSFRKGIAAAKVADKNRAEVQSVFQILNEQLAKETGGKVALRIQPVQGSGHMTVRDLLLPKIHEAIVAYNPQIPKSPIRRVAEWSQDRAGYPCKIKYGLQDIYCENKEGLEAALAALLEDPVVGEALFEIMQLKAANVPEASNKSGEKEGEQAEKKKGPTKHQPRAGSRGRQ